MNNNVSASFVMTFTLLSFHSVGCGGNDGTTATPDAGKPDANISSLNEADCVGFAKGAVSASATCGQPLPAGAETTLTNFCKKGIRGAAMCGGDPAGGLACFKTPDADDYQCAAGNAYPACGGDLASALGMYCLVSLGNPQCASGIKCNFDLDCGGNTACNDATGQCFSKSASCIGLPCKFDLDCPSNEKCNDAEHACVAR
jgi:hypothetical protein